jgi:putative transcriptional regulator
MAITHHPAPESLMSCSAGSMPEACAAVMACHVAVCPACRKELAMLHEIGTALFEAIAPTPVACAAPVVALRGLEADVAPEKHEAGEAGDVPLPLVGAVGGSLDHVKWSRVGPGVWQHRIKLAGDGTEDGESSLRLLKVAPGHALPEHGHAGQELTLVLRGAYRDGEQRFGIGDVADIGDDVEHAPCTDPEEGCICLVATIGRLRFKSPLLRLVQPLTGF